jgi:DNA-binding response OmpR family regulator
MTPEARSAAPHLLVVEDEPVVASLLAEVFTSGGYRVSAFDRVDEAVAAARVHDDLALCLSDFVLLDRTGLDLVRELRKVRPQLRVLLCSAFLETELEQEVRCEPSIVAIVRKPLDVFALRAQVDTLLGVARDAARTSSEGGAEKSLDASC